jgi:hypothetical protein
MAPRGGFADELRSSSANPTTTELIMAPRGGFADELRSSNANPTTTELNMAPRGGFEPPTRCLEGSRSILLSYRGRLGRIAIDRG